LGCPSGINVVKAGYFDYDEVVMIMDHRCMWIDVPFESVFGHDIPLTKRKAARRLHCKDPRLIDNYNKLYHQFATPIQLFQKVQDLDSNAKHMTKSQVIEVYEELDAIRCQATAFAEAKCRKLRTGQVAFSPELSEARSVIKVWSLLVSNAKGQKVSSRFIARSLKKVNLSAEVRGYDKATLQVRLKSAYQEYYKIKSNAKELRQTALENLAEAIAASGNITQEKTLKALREREAQRNHARKIRYLRGKIDTGSTTMVTTQNAQGNKIELTNKQEMEKAILVSNKKKFLQSALTPFYQSPLKDEFSFKGLSLASQAVLAGIYDSNHDIDQRILDVFAQWQMPAAVRELGPLKMEMSVDSYVRYWKKARENTSCFPSALSFATMKAGAFNPQIATIDCMMTRIPLVVGFAPVAGSTVLM
jgi:hypothetical protein